MAELLIQELTRQLFDTRARSCHRLGQALKYLVCSVKTRGFFDISQVCALILQNAKENHIKTVF